MTLYTEKEAADLKITPESFFEDCEFQGIDFTKHSLKSTAFLDCKFTTCNFANISMTNASMRGVTFVGCNMIGINWGALKKFESPVFHDSKINFSSFQGLKLKKTQIINCSAVEVDFSEADLTQADFSNTGFIGSNFNRAILTGADFRTSRDYLFDIRTTQVKGTKFTYPHVISLITVLGAEVDL